MVKKIIKGRHYTVTLDPEAYGRHTRRIWTGVIVEAEESTSPPNHQNLIPCVIVRKSSFSSVDASVGDRGMFFCSNLSYPSPLHQTIEEIVL